MKSDFSRLTFDPARQYAQVLFQQGRPMLDADLNEQTGILLRFIRQATADLIGPHGAPADQENAFALTPLPQTASANPAANSITDFSIGGGRYYVDGLLCENNALSPAKPPSYLTQPYWPQPKDGSKLPGDLVGYLKKAGDSVLVYLEVWEHHRSWLDDGAMRDPALGGSDTAARSQIVWQIRVLSRKSDSSDSLTTQGRSDFDAAVKAKKDLPLLALLQSLVSTRGALRVQLTPDKHGGECGCGPMEARARANENQLYRLEVHRAGAALALTPPTGKADEKTRRAYEDALGKAATFKWSRENGCVAARWLRTQDCDGGGTLRVNGPRDRAHGFAAGDWIEILDEAIEIRREQGVFVRVAKVEGDLLTIDERGGAIPVWNDFCNPKVRRWDQADRGDGYFSAGAVAIQEAAADGVLWLPLENGIAVQFAPAPGSAAQSYRTGDFWIFAVRVGTGQIEWPTPLPDAPEAAPDTRPMPPYGITPHFAPLAIFSNKVDGKPLEMIDLRRKFSPLAKPV